MTITSGVAAMLCVALGATSALAADATPPARATVTWTGFYTGLNIGFGAQSSTATFVGNDPLMTAVLAGTTGLPGATPASAVNVDPRGATAGLQLGYTWKLNPAWVAGVEADLNGSGIRGEGTSSYTLLTGTPPFTLAARQEISWFGTLRAKLGWLANDNLLLYGTGGLAYGRVKEGASLMMTGIGTNITTAFGFGYLCTGGVPCFTGESSRFSAGWTLGGGAELAIASNVSLKAEYLYVNLGADTVRVVAVNPPAPNAAASFNAQFRAADFHLGRIGLNYRF